MWLIGAAMVCLLAAPWVQLSVSAGNGWPHNSLRHQWLMPISCHFRDCKALLVTSLTHVSSAIAGVQTFTFTCVILILLWQMNIVVVIVYTVVVVRSKAINHLHLAVVLMSTVGLSSLFSFIL